MPLYAEAFFLVMSASVYSVFKMWVRQIDREGDSKNYNIGLFFCVVFMSVSGVCALYFATRFVKAVWESSL